MSRFRKVLKTTTVGRQSIYWALRERAVCLAGLLFYSLFDNRGELPRDLWIIGENRGESLLDNGYCFYRYCRKKNPKQSVFFVVKRTSPYYPHWVAADSHVVAYGSLRHAKLFFFAKVCFYTHTYRDVIHRRYFELFGSEKKLVFLHHGVLGFKKFNSFYKEKKNLMDVFTVGNNFERDILQVEEGVLPSKIKVTGYARYDDFFSVEKPARKQIVYMPTHRGFVSGDYTRSLFYDRVCSLLSCPELVGILNASNCILKIYLHKEFQSYSRYFGDISDCMKIVSYHEETPRALLLESDLMVTDYSSVAWDFLFLGKPVVFYRFDVDEYLADRGSYVDLSDTQFGDLIDSEQEFCQVLSSYIDNDFALNNQDEDYRMSIMPNIDNKNCDRIYEEAQSL